MKKFWILALWIILVASTLTGCGNKKVLTCTQEESVSSLEYKFEFKKEKLNKFSVKAQFDFSDVSDVQFESSSKQDYCASFNKSFDDALTNCKQKIDGRLITVSSDVNLDKFSGKLGGNIEEVKIEETKQSFEKEGFKCNIK